MRISFYITVFTCLVVAYINLGCIIQPIELIFNLVDSQLYINTVEVFKGFLSVMCEGANVVGGAPVTEGVQVVRVVEGVPVTEVVNVTETIKNENSTGSSVDVRVIFSFNNVVVFDTMQFFFLNMVFAGVLFFMHLCFCNSDRVEEQERLDDEEIELDDQAIKALNLRVERQKYDADQKEFERQWAEIREGRNMVPYTNIEEWRRDHDHGFDWVARGKNCMVDERKPCKKPWV